MKIIRIACLENDALAPYARLTEAQLRAAGSGEGLFIAESLKVISSALEAGYEPVSILTEERHLAAAESAVGDLHLPVYTGDAELLEQLTGFRLSRGVLAAMKRRPVPSAESVLTNARRVAVLEGINDPTNIGAIFRSAAALGMDAVLVAANCCDPLHRRAARVSMGGVFRIPWAVLDTLDDNASADIAGLHALGFTTAAMALRKDSVSITDPSLHTDKLAILIGSEGNGLTERTISSCDHTVMIPMAHGVDSLNAAAAAAVAFWTLGPCCCRS